MKKGKLFVIIVIAVISVLLIISSLDYTVLAIAPNQLDGNITNPPNMNVDFVNNITDLVRWAGEFIAVGALMVMGIKYVMGSIEEKAGYKKSMLPYVVGCFILFGASLLIPEIEDLLANIGTNNDAVGNSILGIIQYIGSIASVMAIMILGIKYMLGSVEERATYKRTMVPYVIGIVLIFAAVTIVTTIAKIVVI